VSNVAVLPLSRGTLLIVDDDQMQRMLIGEIARRIGFCVDEAASIEEAASLVERNLYTRIVLDLALGGHDGVEVMRHIAVSGQNPAVIVISGFDERIRDAAIRFGQSLGLATAGELRKPINIVRLREALLRDVSPIAQPGPGASGRLTGVTQADLRSAIALGEILPYYQPKIALATGQVIGVEALARWTSPRHGSISPAIFVPLAEDWGLSDDFTHLMMATAIRDAAAWQADHPGVGVAVNMPVSSLGDIALPDRVEALLGRAGLDASCLTVEITETIRLSDDVAIGDILTRMRIKGIKLSLDDFGTGYSSLSSLLRMPFSELKIDRSFIMTSDFDAYAWKIVRATLSLAREFGMTAVAEGIETLPVAAMLGDALCDIGQGYLYARPMSRSTLLRYLAENDRRETSTLPARSAV
jgi:EAL domain-containing protein (putative c-di-GMP-specific phosphodiesterase class I)/ActR/RegA family two-component response regulator